MYLFYHYGWLLLPGLVLGLYAQFKVTSTYHRYLEVPSDCGLSGAEGARRILDAAGLQDMPISEVGGELTDHYDPTKRELFLSSENFHGRSLSALGVAAHETGHALQHKAHYAPLQIRCALVPVTQFASTAAMWLTLLAFFIGLAKLAGVGIVVYGIISLFQLVTLPVEFDASSRAKEQLVRLGLVDGSEHRSISKVLNAAALTYVAALVTSLLSLLQFIMIFRDDDRR